MKYDLVIFDLDGTILNTISDLTAACNAALHANGFPTHSEEHIRTCVGSGVARLIKLATPAGTDEATIQKVLSDFKAEYSAHVNVRTAPYDGIVKLFVAMRRAGIRIGVNSNKIDAATQALCRIHFTGLTDYVLGERPEIPKKPAPDGAKMIMEALGVSPDRTLYVGDSGVDINTAHNAGIDSAWVSWGFRRHDELGDVSVQHAFDTVEELSRFILE